MKTYIYPIIAFLMLGVFTSCLNYDGPPLTEPRYTGPAANVTIADLRERFGHLTEPNTATPIGSNFILRAYVAANDVSGNLFNQMYLQDETGGIIINVAQGSLFNDFRIGQEVFIHLRELFITSFGGQIQIGFAGMPASRIPSEIFNHVVFRNGWPRADRVTPRLVTMDALDRLSNEIMATVVRFDNVFFEGGGEDAFVEDNRTTNRTLFDFYGNSIIVRTSSFASFASDILPEGAGTIVGALTKHNNDWQIILRTIDDLINFEQDIPETTVIFHETFGNPSGNTLIAEYTGWETYGVGAKAVSFAGTTFPNTVDVRSSTTFPGTTSTGNVMFHLNGGTFYINGIATCGAENLRLSFATNHTDQILSVAYRISGTEEWIDIPFTKTTTTWGRVNNLNFTLPTGTNTINLRFEAAAQASGSTNVRIDDVRIVTTDETGEPIIDVEIDVSSTNVVLNGGAGATQTITVTAVPATQAWTATEDSGGWLTLASDIGRGTVTITAAENTTGAPRMATITVTPTGSESKYIEIEVVQGLPPPPFFPGSNFNDWNEFLGSLFTNDTGNIGTYLHSFVSHSVAGGVGGSGALQVYGTISGSYSGTQQLFTVNFPAGTLTTESIISFDIKGTADRGVGIIFGSPSGVAGNAIGPAATTFNVNLNNVSNLSNMVLQTGAAGFGGSLNTERAWVRVNINLNNPAFTTEQLANLAAAQRFQIRVGGGVLATPNPAYNFLIDNMTIVSTQGH